ncbi:MAG: hypothetical protein NVS3B12_14990 [Acidimicrobiales bacterium]
MALAWARQEQAAHGSVVEVDREISPARRSGDPHDDPGSEGGTTLAVVLRPVLAVAQADLMWLTAGLGVAEAAVALGCGPAGVVWPDTVRSLSTNEVLADVRSDVQLGPGRVESAVLTFHVRSSLAAGQDHLIGEILDRLDAACVDLADGGSGVAAAYERLCVQIGARVRVQLRPRGETRGVVSGVDRQGRLVLRSATEMEERVGVDQIRTVDPA